MLHKICRKWMLYSGSLFRTSQYFLQNNHRNSYFSSFKAHPFLRLERKLSSVSKSVFDSKSENSNKSSSTDRSEETSPLHDMELQKFLEEINKDSNDQPDSKKSSVKDSKDDLGEKATTSLIKPYRKEQNSKDEETVNKSDTEKDGTDTTKPYTLTAEEFANLPLSIKERFEQYKDEDSNIIRSAEEISQPLSSWKQKVIEVEENEEVYLYQEKADKLDNFLFERGRKGVFGIEQLVTILKQENMHDIVVIEIPPSLHYCDYMALATAKSPRHLVAVSDFIRRLHKKKKLANEPFLKIEGEDCRDWKAIDMGHIVLHLFLPEARELYDIETLWTVGEKYDPLCNQKADPYEDLLKEHMQFLQNTEPLVDIK